MRATEEEHVPTYQYTCTACGEGLEVVQKFSDDPLTECPKCTGKLRKVFSAVGIVFKGSGFYRTDNRSSSSSSSTTSSSSSSANGSKDSGSATSKDSGSSGKKDSAPAASSAA